MRVAVLGTGSVGRTLAGRLDALGHATVLGTRDPAATRAREGDDLGRWLDEHAAVELATFADAVRAADLVVTATNGAATLKALDGLDDALAGTVLLDVSNPLDFSAGFPPTLFVKDSDSLAEQIQRAHPAARVVKSLNTLTAGLMAHPDELGEPSTVFVAGDDEDAKETVRTLLASFGHTDVLDLGDLTAARGMEMWLPLWLRLYGHLGHPMFNLALQVAPDPRPRS